MSKKPLATRPVGRPPLNKPAAKRHFLQVERDPALDSNLIKAMGIIAEIQGTTASAISLSETVRIALAFYVLNSKMAKDRDQRICPRCNGEGYIAIRNGDDDQICEECGQPITDSDIPY